jgi:DNA-binding NtrC family response regulator
MKTETPATLRLVVIDDDEQHLKFMATVLARENVVVSAAMEPQEGLELIRQRRPHLVLIDLMMPRMNGMELLEKVVAFDPSIDVVLLTGHYSTASAVEAIQKGASDYLTKPVSIEKLQEKIEALLAELRTHERCLELENELVGSRQFAGMVGQSPLMLEMFHRIRRVAPHYRTVLVTGETGAGKELVARAIHQLSPVAGGPLITCNCSALVESLAESELFGHVKGAFTGAVQDRLGVFEAANGGTVFLDEVGELAQATQAKLLRVLQNQEIQRVGSPTVRRVDVRIIAATHRDLRIMVKERRFREDLFYRLSMVHVTLPSLAQRKEDLPLLERYFLERFAQLYRKPVCTFSRRAQAVLARHAWPGNVRELENVIGNACMMAERDTIDVSDLPEYIRTRQPFDIAEGGIEPLEEVEKTYTLRALESVNGNKVKAAELLGISRAKLYRILADTELAEETPDASVAPD